MRVLIVALGVLIGSAVLVSAQEDKEGGTDMNISSPSFRHNQAIPAKFTCKGDDINPALEIENIPEGTKSLVFIIDDPDALSGTWVHWVVFDIPVVNRIEENSIPGTQGMNDSGRGSYGGPCPPRGTHRYFFKLYALDSMLNLAEGADMKIVEKAMQGHILAQTEMIGLFGR